MKLKRFLIIFILLTASVFCFYFLFGNRVPHPISSLEKLIGNQDDSTQWHKIKRTKKVKGVALVVHGLNLKPERMQSIITELNDAGIDVLNLSLRGHGNNYLRNPHLSDDRGQTGVLSNSNVSFMAGGNLHSLSESKAKSLQEKSPCLLCRVFLRRADGVRPLTVTARCVL